MTETQKRIRAYKRALPHMKERVVAVALLLAMSVSMMSSATLAWITLSTSPEASSLATTIVANGNLEIALSDTDGLEPDETAVGDGGQEVALSNLKWGNLVNLSDDSYGLDKIVLRPASLDTRDLINSPMSAVLYGADGRVIDRTTDFAFSNYEKDSGEFVVPTIKNEDGEERNTTKYGVRAVSSVTYKDVTGNAFLIAQVDKINKNFTEARGLFQSIYKSDKRMDTVGKLVAIHVNYILSEQDVRVEKPDVDSLDEIADVFYDSMYYAGCTITEMINLHQYLSLTDATQDQFHAYTFEELFMLNYDGTSKFTSNNINNTVLNEYKEWIQSIDTYRKAWENTVNFNIGVKAAVAKNEVYWKADLMSSANLLCDMDSATLNGLTASQLAADMVNQALKIIQADEDDHVAVIHEGALKDADQLLDGNMYVQSGKVSITVVVPQSIKDKVADKLGSWASGMVPDQLTLKPEIYTSAEPPALLVTDYQSANTRASGGSSLKGVAIAADTYAMAVDFWVRTNVANSLLILEGESDIDPETGAIIGYNGVNRVWDELDDNMSEAGAFIYQNGGTSITQGSGSCYIFYADSPEAQSQSLNMLKAMRVAFVNDKGELLAVADMDTDSKVEESGRVIVPLRLRNQNAFELEDGSTIVDENGEPLTRYIQALTQNKPQRITALVYLDGEVLTNSEVLEAGTIKGQLNIQFGTSDMHMVPMEDGELMQEYYTINFTQKLYELGAYDPNNCTIELKMSLQGTNPTTVKGNFLSIINKTQGARQQEFTMKLGEDGYWIANVPFAGPGIFELRSIQLDGVDVALKPEDQANGVEGNIVRVKIDGVAINSLNCVNWETNTHSVRTAESYNQQQITLSLASDEIHAVRGVFIGDNGQNVSVDFAYQNGMYQGTATFTSGGTYTMTYLEVDGTIMPLPESLYKTISLQLGLKAYVTVGKPVLASGEENEDILKNVEYNPNTGWQFVYNGEKPLNMTASVVIIDDQDERLTGLEGLELWYGVPGSDSTIDTDLTWDPSAGGYDGGFENFQYSGIYQFRYVKLDDTNYITKAASAPSITSIPPDVMEYVYQDEYEPLTYQWDADRNLDIMLKNGAAARLYVTLTKYERTEEGTVEPVKTAQTVVPGGQLDKDTGITTFAVKAPEDGNWKITGLEVDTVFYKDDKYPDGKFFSGAEIYGEDGVTVIGYDRLDLTADVREDNIGTYFLTQVDIAVSSKQMPESGTFATAPFMTPHKVDDMTITVNNQGRPLAKVLEEVKALFPEENINTNVTVGMTYKLEDTKNLSYTWSGSGTVPVYNFGNDNLPLTMDAENMKGYYAVGNMNFLLEGKYYPELSISIQGKDYTTEELLNLLGTSYPPTVSVRWTAPELKITGVSPAMDETFSVDLNLSDGSSSEYQELEGVKNYFEPNYANTYIQTSSKGNHTIPTVTMMLSNIGNASRAYVNLSNTYNGRTWNAAYSFTSTDLEDTQDIGAQTGTSIFNWSSDRIIAGEQKISAINMEYGGVTYLVKLHNKSVTINQQSKPIYLEYVCDDSNVLAPDVVISPDGRPYAFNLATVPSWTLQLSDYDSEGIPTTTSSTVYKLNHTETEGWLIKRTAYYYDHFTRTTTVTEAFTTTTVEDVTYDVTQWSIDGAKSTVGTTVTITAQHAATAIIEETARQTVSVTEKNQRTTVIKDVLSVSNQRYGTSARSSGVVTTVYTSDLYPNGYSYTEDLS